MTSRASFPWKFLPGLSLPPEVRHRALEGEYVNADGVRMRVVNTGKSMPTSTAKGDDPPRWVRAYEVQFWRKGWRAWESRPDIVTQEAIAAYLVGYGFARVR